MRTTSYVVYRVGNRYATTGVLRTQVNARPNQPSKQSGGAELDDALSPHHRYCPS